jgi:putative sigma-54 modulation protein
MTNNTREFPVTITARHDDISDTLKADVHHQIQKLSKYNPNIMDAKIIIDKQNTTFKVDISLQVPGSFITGKNEDYDLSKALDASIAKAKNQIKRLRDRIVDHKTRPTAERFDIVEEPVEMIDELADDE